MDKPWYQNQIVITIACGLVVTALSWCGKMIYADWQRDVEQGIVQGQAIGENAKMMANNSVRLESHGHHIEALKAQVIQLEQKVAVFEVTIEYLKDQSRRLDAFHTPIISRQAGKYQIPMSVHGAGPR